MDLVNQCSCWQIFSASVDYLLAKCKTFFYPSRTTGKYCFQRCVSIHRMGGGGYHSLWAQVHSQPLVLYNLALARSPVASHFSVGELNLEVLTQSGKLKFWPFIVATL